MVQRANGGGADAPSGEDVRRLVQENLGDDPAGKYILDFMDGKRPDSLQDRVKDIRRCLATKHHSLALTGLLWRDVAEWCLEGTHPSKRSGEECETLRTTVVLLARTTRSWRVEALQDKIAVFLDREKAPRMSPQSKAMPNRKLWRARQAARNHWRNVLAEMSKSPEMMRALEEYLDACQSAAEMKMSFTASKSSGLVIFTGEGRSEVKDEDALGLFDIIIVPEDAAPTVVIPLGGAAEADLGVKLPKGTELAYADVLRLAYEQNGGYLDSLLKSDKVQQAADFPWPLLLPALRAEEQSLLEEMEKEETALKAKGDEEARQRLEEKRRRLRETRERLARIWLY